MSAPKKIFLAALLSFLATLGYALHKASIKADKEQLLKRQNAAPPSTVKTSAPNGLKYVLPSKS